MLEEYYAASHHNLSSAEALFLKLSKCCRVVLTVTDRDNISGIANRSNFACNEKTDSGNMTETS